MSSTWCPIPWLSQSIRNNGDIRLCCHANPSEGGGILRDESGQPLNGATADLKLARNASLLREVRRSMREGKWHEACTRCRTEEASNIRSRRTYETETWKNTLGAEHSLTGTDASGAINLADFPLRHADVRFGNLCNLKCRSCGPTDSSKWYGDHVKVHGDTFRERTVTIKLSEENGRYIPSPNPYSWYENPKFWVELEAQMPTIRQLYLVGGEPLLIEAHYDFLNKCVEGGYAKQIKLEYNSNITSIPERAWDLWKHFEMVQVGASLDGIGPVNEYIRFPSKWPKLFENLKRLDEAEGKFSVLISSTIMIYNVFHFPDMLIWKAQYDFKRVNLDPSRPLITPHPLHRPHHLNIQALPRAVKNKVVEHYKNKKLEVAAAIERSTISDKQKALKSATQLLDKYVDFMWQQDLSSHWEEFKRYTKKLDEIRGQSLKDSIPELYEAIADHY